MEFSGKGLTEEDHMKLNRRKLHADDERQELIDALRRKYHALLDPLALEQIEVYEDDSLHYQLMSELQLAVIAGELKKADEIEALIAIAYPYLHERNSQRSA